MADGVRLNMADDRLYALDNRLTEISNLIIKIREETNARWNELEKVIIDLKREIGSHTAQSIKDKKGKAPTRFNYVHENGIRSEFNSMPFDERANSSGNHLLMKYPSWSGQPQSSLSVKIKSDKLSIVSNEIAELIQKLLPRPSEHPTWIPPSRDFMNESLTCQTCKNILNQVDNLLVCDGCEKGFHLNCVHYDSDRYPRGFNWLCEKCSENSNNGDPPQPKYGRVIQ